MHGSRCWAKTTGDGEPGISVRDHCLNVGHVAKALVERLPPMLACKLPTGIITLAATHDVGELSPDSGEVCELDCPEQPDFCRSSRRLGELRTGSCEGQPVVSSEHFCRWKTK